MFKKILIYLIKFYQYIISPILPAKCRFLPVCSEYAIESIKTHGVFRGFILSIKRIAKCHPFGKSGIDEVPIEKTGDRGQKSEKKGKKN